MNFEIVETGAVGMDGSIHNILKSDNGGFVEFTDMPDKIIAHTWLCPGEGRAFLRQFEQMADESKRRLEIPNVVSAKLLKILKDDYKKEMVPFAPEHGINDLVEIWIHEK